MNDLSEFVMEHPVTTAWLFWTFVIAISAGAAALIVRAR